MFVMCACVTSRLLDARMSLQGSVRTPYSWAAFKTGLRSGALLVLVFWVIYDCLDWNISDEKASAWAQRILPLYRAYVLPAVCLLCSP
jgi:hypothetical protein